MGAAAAQALQRILRRLGQPAAGGLAALQLVKQRLLGRLLAVAQQVGRQHRAMKGDEPRFARNRQVQGGDVAVADKRLGVAAQQLKVNLRQQARAAIAAAQANDGVHARVGKGGVQLLQALGVAGGQIVVLHPSAGVGAGVELRDKAARAQPVGHFLRAPGCGRGRRQHGHRAARAQSPHQAQASDRRGVARHGGRAAQLGVGRWGFKERIATAAAGL